jgi:hypothetical protein
VHVRPLRRPRAPGNPRSDPRTQRQSQKGLFLASDHRPPLAGLKLVRPRPRLTARRCGRSSLTPARATAQTGSSEKKPQQQSHPNPAVGDRVTGSIQHGPLTAGVPMGADMPLGRTSQQSDEGYSRRSGPWGFKTGPSCETITAIADRTRTCAVAVPPDGYKIRLLPPRGHPRALRITPGPAAPHPVCPPATLTWLGVASYTVGLSAPTAGHIAIKRNRFLRSAAFVRDLLPRPNRDRQPVLGRRQRARREIGCRSTPGWPRG